jgi:hypothetical protein
MPTPANVRLSSQVLADLADAVTNHRDKPISLVTLDDYSIEDGVIVGASFTVSIDTDEFGETDYPVILGEL